MEKLTGGWRKLHWALWEWDLWRWGRYWRWDGEVNRRVEKIV